MKKNEVTLRSLDVSYEAPRGFDPALLYVSSLSAGHPNREQKEPGFFCCPIWAQLDILLSLGMITVLLSVCFQNVIGECRI